LLPAPGEPALGTGAPGAAVLISGSLPKVGGLALSRPDEGGRALDPGERRRELVRLGVSVLLLAVQLAFALIAGDELAGGARAGGRAAALAVLHLLLGLPVALWCAAPVYRRAVAELRRGRVVRESLFALGTLAAFAVAGGTAVQGGEPLCIETATLLVTVALGARLAVRRIERAALARGPILRFAAEPGESADRGALARGATLRVEAGEAVPADVRAAAPVVVREGLLTGRWQPIARAAGEVVLAGSTVETGRLEGVVVAEPAETLAHLLGTRVRAALAQAVGAASLADRIAQVFVPVVLLVAVVSLVGHAAAGSGSAGVLAAVAVLVTVCPFAPGAAAVAGQSLAVLRLARAGVFVRDPGALARVARADVAVFELCGGLTAGAPVVRRLEWLGPEDPALLAAAATLAAAGADPVARQAALALGSAAGPAAPALPARVIGIDDPSRVTARELRRRGVRRGERLLLRTRNSEAAGPARRLCSEFVALDRGAAALLAARHVRAVGVDALSIGPPDAEGDEVHRLLLGAGIWIVEGLDLRGVTPGDYELVCLPLKLAGADGAPARAAAAAGNRRTGGREGSSLYPSCVTASPAPMKLRTRSRPSGVRIDSGWNCRPWAG
jgi:cation transport ATPase